MPRRTKFNRKREIQDAPDFEELARLARRVTYDGSPAHKRDPGDFGLLPPAQPREDKTLCDDVGITRREDALRLLREGISRGLVSVQRRGDFPQNVWAVAPDGTPLEAQLGNRVLGSYHGYPLSERDRDIYSEVLTRWEQGWTGRSA